MENSNWKEYKFSELLIDNSISYGVVQPGFHTENGIPIIRVNNIKNGNINISDILRIDSNIEKKYLRTRLKGGELLITIVGSVGDCAIVPKSLAGYNVARAVSVANINSLSTPEYIKYAFKTEDLKFQMYGNTNDTVQPTLNLAQLKELVIKLPPLPEQKAIASVLSSLDDKIDLLHQQNQTLEALAETLFRQWFIEEAKEDWEEKPLSSVATFLNGLACQKYPPKDNIKKLPVLKIKELTAGITDNSDWATTEIKPEYIIKNGDVIFAWSASLMVKIWNGEDCILNQHLFKVTSEEFPKWFYYFWCKQYLREFISIAQSHATTMGHIKRSDLDEAIVLIPDNDEIEKMTFQMNPILDKIQLNNNQINSLSKLRDTLLPKLMGGEVRLKMDAHKNVTT